MDEIKYKAELFKRRLDNFIKAITFISFLLFLSTFYIYKYRSGEIYKNQVALCDVVLSQGLTEENPLDNPIHSFLLSSKDECFAKASSTVSFWLRVSFIAFDITILLPIVYFGGRKVASDAVGKISKKNELIASQA